MSREAMQLALHTLEGWANYGKWVWPESALEQAKRNTTESIAALRQALVDADDTSQKRVDEKAKRKHEWVGLTDEEVSEIIDREIGFNSCWGPEDAFARAIEAKLKEKNT